MPEFVEPEEGQKKNSERSSCWKEAEGGKLEVELLERDSGGGDGRRGEEG